MPVGHIEYLEWPYLWRSDGRFFDSDLDTDLIAYLGPPEEEKRETLCWNCSKPYPMHDPWCPFCRATNANVNQEAALAEATAKTQPEGIITRLERELAEALSEVGKLKLEIAALEKSRNHCEFCDAVIAVKAIAHPRIPMTTPQLERYTTPMLGTQR